LEVLEAVGERNTFRMWAGVARRCSEIMSEIIGGTAAAAVMHAAWARLASNVPGAATVAVLGLDAGMRRMVLRADALGVAAALFSASSDAERHAAADIYFHTFIERLHIYDSVEQLVRFEALAVQALVTAAPGSLGSLASKVGSVLQSTSSFVQPRPDAFVVVVPHHLWLGGTSAHSVSPSLITEVCDSFVQANASALERRRLVWQPGHCGAVVTATWPTGSMELRGIDAATASVLLQLSGQCLGYALPTSTSGHRGQLQRLADAHVLELRADTVLAASVPPRAAVVWAEGDRVALGGRAAFAAPTAVAAGPREGSQVIQAAACRVLKREGPMTADRLLALLHAQRPSTSSLTEHRLQLELRELIEREYISMTADGVYAYLP
jgi:hypothetical protein